MQLAVDETHGQFGEDAPKPLVLGRGRRQFDLGAVLDQGAHHKCLMARGDFLANQIPGPFLSEGADREVLTGLRPGGISSIIETSRSP